MPKSSADRIASQLVESYLRGLVQAGHPPLDRSELAQLVRIAHSRADTIISRDQGEQHADR